MFPKVNLYYCSKPRFFCCVFYHRMEVAVSQPCHAVFILHFRLLPFLSLCCFLIFKKAFLLCKIFLMLILCVHINCCSRPGWALWILQLASD